MNQVKITLALVIAVLLQWTLRNVAEPFAFVDFPLIIIVYAAIQKDAIRALVFAFIAGLAVDALSHGLLGSNGFSKIIVAYIISEVARRVYLDNLLLRIPVLAGACLLNSLIYYGIHRLFGQAVNAPLVVTLAYTLIGTTIAGTIIFIALEGFSGQSLRGRKRPGVFTERRQTRRRNPIRLGKR